MKTRVKYDHGWFYPQYKGWLFWEFIFLGDNIMATRDEQDAINYLSSDQWKRHGQVVWESKGTK